jgi:ABC-type transport system involved in cytochrome bd biosynthesis fused ATPase/permease subunit
MRQGLLDHILNLGTSFTHTGKTGAIIASVSEGVEKLDDYFTRYIPSVIHIMILPAVIIVFTFYFDWPSGLIMLITGPLILFFMWTDRHSCQKTHGKSMACHEPPVITFSGCFARIENPEDFWNEQERIRTCL